MIVNSIEVISIFYFLFFSIHCRIIFYVIVAVTVIFYVVIITMTTLKCISINAFQYLQLDKVTMLLMRTYQFISGHRKLKSLEV